MFATVGSNRVSDDDDDGSSYLDISIFLHSMKNLYVMRTESLCFS